MESKAGRHEVSTGPEDAGERLDRLLAGRLEGLSRSRVKALIEAGQVSAGGAPLSEPSTRVKAGQTFAIVVPEAAPTEIEGQAMALDVIYEDSDIIVVDKPAGLVVHPAPGNPDRTLVNALIAHCGPSLAGVGGVRRPGIVHRLDKDTSGLMVAAKTDAAHRDLVEQFAGREIERRYGAVVWGRPEPAQGEITGNIGRSPRNRKKMAVLRRGGRPAATRYEVRRPLAGGRASLIDCKLLTGRTHQIRVHLSERGHPVIGDPLYGGGGGARRRALPEPARDAVAAMTRQALHASLLGLRHPRTDEMLRFESEFPSDIKRLISSLEII